jgi:hypothetical protein
VANEIYLSGSTEVNDLLDYAARQRSESLRLKAYRGPEYEPCYQLNGRRWNPRALQGRRICEFENEDGFVKVNVRFTRVAHGLKRDGRSSPSRNSVERALAAVDISDLWEEESQAARIEQALRVGAREHQAAAARVAVRRALVESPGHSDEEAPPRPREDKGAEFNPAASLDSQREWHRGFSEILGRGAKAADTAQFDHQAAEGEKECAICMDNAVQVALVPCGHRLYCNGCAAKLKECSVCRAKIQSLLRTFEN